MLSRQSAPSKAGFTLIELLVVIAIIAILAAILFPVFAQARDKARQASCQSNMKQFGIAWMMYSQDYDETALPGRWGSNGNQYFDTRALMDPYVKNKDIYICISNGQTDQTQLTYTYTYNWCVATTCGGGNDHPIASIPLPAQTPAFAESNNTQYSNIDYFFAMVDATTFWGRRIDIPGNNVRFFGGAFPKMVQHAGGSNLQFVDGHVKWYRQQAGLNLYSDSYTQDKAWFTGSTNQPGPPREGMDYDSDGIVGTAAGYE